MIRVPFTVREPHILIEESIEAVAPAGTTIFPLRLIEDEIEPERIWDSSRAEQCSRYDPSAEKGSSVLVLHTLVVV